MISKGLQVSVADEHLLTCLPRRRCLVAMASSVLSWSFYPAYRQMYINDASGGGG